MNTLNFIIIVHPRTKKNKNCYDYKTQILNIK